MDKLAMFGGARAVPKQERIKPWPKVTEADQEAVARVILSGRFTSASAGEAEISSLEREWAEFIGTRHSVAVSNGTSALSVALGALGIQPGDEVIVPALSFIASAVAPLHLLAVPVFVDIDPVTFNLTPAAVEAAITPRTRAIVVVHLHGLPADMDEIMAIAQRHGIAVVEDAAQAQGAVYRGRKVGSIGAVNTFSLNVSKNLPTCGEGGLINTDDDELATASVMLRQFGELIPARGERSYVAHRLGWNCKPNAVQAAFTRSQLTRFVDEDKVRDANVRGFLDRLAELDGLVVPQVPTDRTHAWHILRFTVDPVALGLEEHLGGPLRAALMRALKAEGVAVSHYQLMPLPGQRIFQERSGFGGYPWSLAEARTPSYDIEDFPNTLRVIDTSMTIQKAHLDPDAAPLLDRYADAFAKVWSHLGELEQYVRATDHQQPWVRAAAIADSERAVAAL